MKNNTTLYLTIAAGVALTGGLIWSSAKLSRLLKAKTQDWLADMASRQTGLDRELTGPAMGMVLD